MTDYGPLIHRDGEREKCGAKVASTMRLLVEAMQRPTVVNQPDQPKHNVWTHWLERLRHAVGKWHEPLHTSLEIVPEYVPETDRVRIRVRVHWQPMSWIVQEGTAWNPNLDPAAEEPLVERVDWQGDSIELGTEVNVALIDRTWIPHLVGRHVILPAGVDWLPPLSPWTGEMDNQAFAKRMALKRRRQRRAS